MIRYAAIIAVIVVATAVAWQQSQRAPRAVGANSEAVLQQWPKVTPKQVRAIQIHHGATTVQLHRNGEQWMVKDRYGEVAANKEQVTRLLNDVTAMAPQRLISNNPDNFTRFRLGDDADRLTLLGDAGKPLLDLLIGKPGTDLISTTVRQAGSNAILSVNRSLAWQLGRAPSAWRAEKPKPTPKSTAKPDTK